MKYTVAALAFAALVRAQSRDDIPECAIPCLDDAIQSETDCDVTDYACVCPKFSDIQSTATGCVVSECGAETALNEVLPAVEALCEAVGNTPTTSAEPTEEPTDAPTEEPTTAPEPTTEEPPTTMPTFTPTVSVPPPPPTHAPEPNGTQTEPPSPIPTGGAAALGSIGALGLAALGLLAL